MNKPRPIDEWGLCKKSARKVRRELKKWLKLFLEQSSGRTGNIYRANFLEQDFFFFTDCTDILSKDPEGRGQELSLDIRKRKRNVFNQLFIRTLLGEKLGKKIKCSHCGYDDCFINGFDGGHYIFCPHCQKTDVITYPNAYLFTMQDVVIDLLEKGYIREEMFNYLFDMWSKDGVD